MIRSLIYLSSTTKEDVMKRLAFLIALTSATLAYAGTDYFYVSQPIGDIDGKTMFNTTYYPADKFNKPVWSVDNSTGSSDGTPANHPGIAFSGWNLGDFTGLPVPTPLQNYQRSKPGASYGGTAVSMHDVMDGGVLSPRFGAMLNAYGIPYTPDTYENGRLIVSHRNIMGANLGYAFSGVDHRPFSRGDSSVFNFSMMLQIPSVAAEGSARAHAGPSFTLQDMTDPFNRYIWFAHWAFDYPSGNNGPAPVQSIGEDVATASYIVGSSFNQGTTYSTMVPGSSASTNQPWSGWKWFAFTVSYAQIKKALEDINTAISRIDDCKLPQNFGEKKCTHLSTNPANYKLGMLHLDAEFVRTNANGGGYMGLSNYGWWAYSTY